MRTLAIDVREALNDRPTGKARWTRCFVEELLTRSIPLLLIGHRPLPTSWMLPQVKSLTLPRGLRWHLAAARALFRRRHGILAFSPTSFIVPALVGGSVPVIPLVHDLIAFRKEPHLRKAQIIEHLTLRRALSSARHVCVISGATKNDLLNRYRFLSGDAISVVFAGPYVAAAPLSEPDGRTILSVGTLCPRKNQLRLIQAYARLPEDLRARTKLIIAGCRGWNDRDIIRLAQGTPGVEWQGYVTDHAYEELLAHASVFAYPSLYEGFGMPVLDALQRGIPVLTSRRGSLPEVAGAAAEFVDPEDVASITDGLVRLLRDPLLRERLRSEGPRQAETFSWKRTVDLFLGALQPFL